MPYVISGTLNGDKVYWRKWTSASVSGRPKWVSKLTLNCLFAQQPVAQKTANGNGSSHFTTTTPTGPVCAVAVEEIVYLP